MIHMKEQGDQLLGSLDKGQIFDRLSVYAGFDK